jgi:hypothetical protein
MLLKVNEVLDKVDPIIELLDTCSQFQASYLAASVVHRIGSRYGVFFDQKAHVSFKARGWVKSAPWDGKDRIADLFDTLRLPQGTSDAQRTQYKEYLLAWLRDAMLKTGPDYQTGYTHQQQHMLVLEGPHNVGKTLWVQYLVGPCKERQQDFVSCGGALTPQLTAMWRMTGSWIAEITRISDHMARGDIKTTINADSDTAPSGRLAENRWRKRRCIFIGTTTRELVWHEQRNWRILTIPVESCAVIREPSDTGTFLEDIDMQQLWAQVLHGIDTGTIKYNHKIFDNDVRAWPTSQLPPHLRAEGAKPEKDQRIVREHAVHLMFEPVPKGTPKRLWLSGTEARLHFLACTGDSQGPNAAAGWRKAAAKIEQLWGKKAKASVIRYPIKKRELP